MRQILITLLVVLVVGAAVISVYVIFSKEEEPISDTLYDAIPLDAGLIIDVRNFGDLCHVIRENHLWAQLNKISSVQDFTREMMLLDSLTQKYESGISFRHHLILSVHPVGKEDMRSIGYVKMNNEKEAKNFIDHFKGQFAGKITVSQRSYDQVSITDVAFNDKNHLRYNFSCAYRSGIFVFSHSSILLENALRQIAADHNITQQGRLAELMRTAGKTAPANIYINYQQLPRTALTIFQAKYRKIFEPLSRYAEWTELDFNLKSDLLFFNGFTMNHHSSEQWLATIQSQPAIPVTLADAMPTTTYAFLWLGIRQLQQYFSDYGRYLDQYKETDYKKELSRIKNTFQIDLQKDFMEQFEDEAAIVYANVGQTQSKEATFTLFRVKSTLSAIEMLEGWQDKIKKYNSASNGQNKETLPFDHQLNFTAYKLPFDIPASLFGDIFSGENSWCVIADNYMVFGSSPANLKKYLHYTALHASLQTDVTYGKLVNHFSTRSNIMFYCNPSLSGDFFENTLKTEKIKEFKEADDAVSQIQAVVFQLNNTSGMLYNNLFLKYAPEDGAISAGAQTSWESLLDTAISFKPQLVQNHNTGETEIFVQDMANNIYLLNNVGRILWKMALPEPILSPVYQIDIYRNGKLQMLFNTKNRLYVIDRLGNFVEKFPITLKSPAVGSVALFDYDNDKKYRMMIACEDRKIYAYEKTGNPLDGWNFGQSEYPVQTDIYHYRAGNKDFIVFADKYRVYILDRQGKTRITPQHNLPVSNQTVIALDQSRSPKQSCLVLTDTIGTVHFISLSDGSMTQQSTKIFPSSHFFVFQDVDGDKQGDFIYASGNKLEVFRQDAKQILDINTEESITMRPYVYEFSASDKKIGIVQSQNNHIWLYDNNGKVHKGFPLKGSTLFSIGRLDKKSSNFNLFVGSKNNFLYNYSVN